MDQPIVEINEKQVIKKLTMNNKEHFIHPIYDLYAANDGEIIHIIKQKSMKVNLCHNGYMLCCVRKNSQSVYKCYRVHRFVWECFNGIPDGKVIDHIDNNPTNNRLTNLQLFTPSENNKKSVKSRGYSFVAKNHNNKKCVKATNQHTNEVTNFDSNVCSSTTS